ncbi:hypothetical protein TIFTF001_020165 [Ficus carica]|uniref:Kinesin-like protein n=1 Tax=Ficus carica TaxID=3494 RepID=A0AA88A817_FICCA|nr:hypothetical protein TIFTF001_020165 [Ficus carica]
MYSKDSDPSLDSNVFYGPSFMESTNTVYAKDSKMNDKKAQKQNFNGGLVRENLMASALRSSMATGHSTNNNTSGRFEKQQAFLSTSLNGSPFSSSSGSGVSSKGNGVSNHSGRVRVAVRVRPRNAEDLLPDSDFVECVELQPELKRLKLRKNNWSTESYRFDEVFTETASQKRVYEAVAKPVVESVLNGYNGTVMAYGQTGTGKTYTLGRLGKDDTSERGIMYRALEDILSSISPAFDSVEISYLQLYMESIQDLLAPEKVNIPINDDPKTGEVSLPGASVVKIQDLDHFLQLLQIGETNRHAANTKLNTESSRSHAILMVYVRRPVHENAKDGFTSEEKVSSSGSNVIPMVRKSKLLIVDLAGSERIDKSGSEGHMLEEAKFINLSLTSLGKCINALAENSPHIPCRESKLTRLLRDSFGGTSTCAALLTSEYSSTVISIQYALMIMSCGFFCCRNF